MKKRGLIWIFLLLFIPIIAAQGLIDDSLHINIQTTNSSGGITTGTFQFQVNITNSTDCSNVLYTDLQTLTTDSRGIVSLSLDSITFNFTEQYNQCIYADGILQSNSSYRRVPYAFNAKTTDWSGVRGRPLNLSEFFNDLSFISANSTFNQSKTDTLYTAILWNYNQSQTTWNYNQTIGANNYADGVSGNSTFNQSKADILYAGLSSWNVFTNKNNFSDDVFFNGNAIFPTQNTQIRALSNLRIFTNNQTTIGTIIRVSNSDIQIKPIGTDELNLDFNSTTVTGELNASKICTPSNCLDDIVGGNSTFNQSFADGKYPGLTKNNTLTGTLNITGKTYFNNDIILKTGNKIFFGNTGANIYASTATLTLDAPTIYSTSTSQWNISKSTNQIIVASDAFGYGTLNFQAGISPYILSAPQVTTKLVGDDNQEAITGQWNFYADNNHFGYEMFSNTTNFTGITVTSLNATGEVNLIGGNVFIAQDLTRFGDGNTFFRLNNDKITGRAGGDDFFVATESGIDFLTIAPSTGWSLIVGNPDGTGNSTFNNDLYGYKNIFAPNLPRLPSSADSFYVCVYPNGTQFYNETKCR